MTILEIVKHPNPILEQKCETVTKFDKKLSKLLDDMHETMLANDGVGIAAPQVNVGLRVAIVDFNEGQEPIEMINPELALFEGLDTDIEGCLSFPELSAKSNVRTISRSRPRNAMAHGMSLKRKATRRGRSCTKWITWTASCSPAKSPNT